MSVLSRSESGDCVKDFLTPPKPASLNSYQYKHFACGSRCRNAGWAEVELGKEPAAVLTLLDEGVEAAFFSVFQQTGGNVHESSISLRSKNDVRYAIHRGRTFYHRLFPDSDDCRKLPSDKVEEYLTKRAQQDRKLDLPAAWRKLFEAIREQEFDPRWYEPTLSGDPLHELDKVSGTC